MENKLYRSDKDVVFSGVCGGLAEYFGINVTALRVCMVLFCGATFWLYIALIFIMPKRYY